MKPIFETLDSSKLAYLVMRKCGCTSILAAFEKLRNPHQAVPKIKELHGERDSFRRAGQISDIDEWYTFTLVRDPIRRFLSFYANKVVNRSLGGNMSIGDPKRFGYRTNMSLDSAIDVAVSEKFEPETHVVSDDSTD